MNSPPLNEYYFAILRDEVVETISRGRKALAAGLKPRLQTKSNGAFDEKILGYATFKQFLDAAEQHGYVALRLTPSDVEVLASPIADETSASQTRPAPGRGQQIRSDLWKAWIDWSEDVARVYDRELDKTELFPAQESPAEPEQIATLRAAVATNPTRYVPIRPLSTDETLAAMRSFADGWPNGVERAELLQSLEAASPQEAAVAFTRRVKHHPPAASHWHQTRMKQVADAIADWAASNSIELTYIVDSERRTAPASTRESAAPGPRSQDAASESEAMRRKILEAVGRMPLSELLRLPIPAEYLIRH